MNGKWLRLRRWSTGLGYHPDMARTHELYAMEPCFGDYEIQRSRLLWRVEASLRFGSKPVCYQCRRRLRAAPT